uniref:Uncharacterized protein n=1 Tax=Glossina pallidipes TaxID=7398 RepID=A0A1B0A2W1_GLOPL
MPHRHCKGKKKTKDKKQDKTHIPYLESDNGSQFASAEFKELAAKRKLTRKTSSPYRSIAAIHIARNILNKSSHDASALHLLHILDNMKTTRSARLVYVIVIDCRNEVLSLLMISLRSIIEDCFALRKKVLLTGVNILQKPQRKSKKASKDEDKDLCAFGISNIYMLSSMALGEYF